MPSETRIYIAVKTLRTYPGGPWAKAFQLAFMVKSADVPSTVHPLFKPIYHMHAGLKLFHLLLGNFAPISWKLYIITPK